MEDYEVELLRDFVHEKFCGEGDFADICENVSKDIERNREIWNAIDAEVKKNGNGK